MFTITIENLLRFHEYFDDKVIFMKNFPLDFEKVRSTHISCGWLCTIYVERLGREKIVQISSAILNLVTWPASVKLVPGLLVQKMLWALHKMDCI